MSRAINRTAYSEAVVWGRGFENYGTRFDRMVEWSDAVVVLENYHAEWVPNLKKLKKPTLYWSIDAHVNYSRNVNFAKTHNFNLVLSSTFSILSKFRKNKIRCEWFPNCYPKNLIRPLDVKTSYDVGFCGNYVKGRKKWLDNLSNYCNLKKDIFIIGAAMVRAINSYKIHWNKNYSIDINYRTFETLGCKTFLLTNKTDCLSNMFSIGKELVTYKTFDDCVDKIKYYLRNPVKRQAIAEAGHERARKFHTYDNRAETLIKIIEGI